MKNADIHFLSSFRKFSKTNKEWRLKFIGLSIIPSVLRNICWNHYLVLWALGKSVEKKIQHLQKILMIKSFLGKSYINRKDSIFKSSILIFKNNWLECQTWVKNGMRNLAYTTSRSRFLSTSWSNNSRCDSVFWPFHKENSMQVYFKDEN